MKKFIVLYRAPMSAMEKMKDKSPEDMKAGMAKWMEWAAKCGDALLEMGSPLGNGQKVTPDGSSDANSTVAGYSVLQAEDMAGAKALLEGHPHLGWDAGCDIEVYECLPMPA